MVIMFGVQAFLFLNWLPRLYISICCADCDVACLSAVCKARNKYMRTNDEIDGLNIVGIRQTLELNGI